MAETERVIGDPMPIGSSTVAIVNNVTPAATMPAGRTRPVDKRTEIIRNAATEWRRETLLQNMSSMQAHVNLALKDSNFDSPLHDGEILEVFASERRAAIDQAAVAYEREIQGHSRRICSKREYISEEFRTKGEPLPTEAELRHLPHLD